MKLLLFASKIKLSCCFSRVKGEYWRVVKGRIFGESGWGGVVEKDKLLVVMLVLAGVEVDEK